MNEFVVKQPKRRVSFCCALWIVVLVVLATIYLILSIQFAHRVNLFNTKVEIGMEEMDVLLCLGNPSSIDYNYGMSDGKVYHEIFYSGRLFFRESLILYFDSQTKKLVQKDRGLSFR